MRIIKTNMSVYNVHDICEEIFEIFEINKYVADTTLLRSHLLYTTLLH